MKENKRYQAIEIDAQGNPIPGTETILWNSRSAAVTCVLLSMAENSKDIKFLVEKRGPGCPDNIGKYVFPCGYLGWDETLQEAVIREVYEETGIKLAKDMISEPISIQDSPEANRQNITVRFLAYLPTETIEQGLKDGTINCKTEERGGEPGECEELLLVTSDWVGEHKDEFAFGHDLLVNEVMGVLKNVDL